MNWFDLPTQPFGTKLSRVEISQAGTISYEWTVTWWGLPFYWGSFVFRSIADRMRITIISNLSIGSNKEGEAEVRTEERSSRISSRDLSSFRKVH
jgi:hypothetical protein